MKQRFLENEIVYIAPYGLKCRIIEGKIDKKNNTFQYLCAIKLGSEKIKKWIHESLLTRDPLNFSDNWYLNTAMKEYFTSSYQNNSVKYDLANSEKLKKEE